MRFLDLNMLDMGELGGQTQPGLSAFQDGMWVHGQKAFSICRQDPQSVRYNVWESLSLDPCGLAGGARHLADLAVGQLQTLCKDLSRDVWTVYTPVHWDKTQLQVFLGVAGVCRMDVRALLPRMLAAGKGSAAQEVEWQWNQRCAADVVLAPEGLHIKSFTAEVGGGVLDLFRKHSRVVAQWALETHRLDPLYSGASEQKLFEGWWTWQQGRGNWRYQSADLDLDFSELSHLEIVRTEMLSPVQSLEGRLGDLSQPGTRWKEYLPVAEG
ncbi:hypothetical protein P0Y35_01855 [Kiritimatiellaeota bacterium B1221]|nr:hypothetical protein [Kiritimatiellaeota bacterium B1221]